MDNIFKPNHRKWITPTINLGQEAIKLRQIASTQLAGLGHGLAQTAPPAPPSHHEETRERTRMKEKEQQDIRTLVNSILKPPEGAESMERINEALANMAAARKEFDSMNIECSDSEESDSDSSSGDDVNLNSTDDSTEDEEEVEEKQGCAPDGFAAYKPSAIDLIQKIEVSRANEEVDEAEPRQAGSTAPLQEVLHRLHERDRKHDAEFAVNHQYSEVKAKERVKTALWREKRGQQELFGMDDPEYFEMARKTASTLAFDKHEVMVDDLVLEGIEMPLLAGPIPHKSIMKLTTLALYSSLSDEPGNFQWKSTHVMEQLTANQQAERQIMRKYHREGRRMEKVWPPHEFIVTVSFYQPSELATYDLKAAAEPKLGLEIELLGSHTLLDLQKQFYCQRNYACTKDCGEFKKWITIEEAMGMFENDLSMNVCRGDVLYIHDTCYTDGSSVAHDHFANVRHWISDVPNEEIEQYAEKTMAETKISDLTLRFGYPYMYLHQGDCEHIVVFNAMRLPRAVEYLTFPRYEILGKYTTKFCRIDKDHMARWIVTGSDRFPEDPIYLCNSCVQDYCFTKGSDGKSGEKIGDFKLFPFLQITAFV